MPFVPHGAARVAVSLAGCAAALFAEEAPETAEQPWMSTAMINGIFVPMYALRSAPYTISLPHATRVLPRATRILTAVLLCRTLSQFDGRDGAEAMAAAAAALRRRSRSSKFSRACGAPIFPRACGAPRHRKAARRRADGGSLGCAFCGFP